LENTGNTSIADTGRFWKILVIPVLQILEDSGKLYQYCRYWEDTGKILVLPVLCTSIVIPESRPAASYYPKLTTTIYVDTGRFWKILVIPILQILEDSGKYWLYQYCRYWKIR
jgi:hypothetical protein